MNRYCIINQICRFFPIFSFSQTLTVDLDKHKNESFVKKEEFVLPDWLMHRREMIFPETSVIKGQQLGRGQFGIVQKGELVQGYAK